MDENSEIDGLALVDQAVRLAHQRLCLYGKLQPDLNAMGTTVALTWFRQQQVIIGHVGDSRVYCLNHEGLIQLTEDHSHVQTLVRQGSITLEEAARRKDRNLLTQALGKEPLAGPEVRMKTCQPGEIYLLCTDGLTTMVPLAEMTSIIQQCTEDLQQGAENLIQRANDYGGLDNIAVVLVKYGT